MLKQFVPVLLCLLHYFAANGQAARNDSIPDKKKLALICGTSVAGLASSYIYVRNAWWSKQRTSFHFDHDRDYRYARNMDKAAHFIGGVMSAELFKAGFYWTGMRKGPAYFAAGALGSVMQVFVEIKDGYAPTYGFSIGDVAAGTIGSFIPYIKYRFPATHALNIKLSYYRRHDYYYRAFKNADFIDDYMNQTYWVSLSLNDWLRPQSQLEKWWPDFLCVAAGWGVDETLNNLHSGKGTYADQGMGNYEWYITLDVDWRKLIRQNSNFKKALASTLNYIKLPLPTFRLGPDPQFYFWFL